MWDLPRPGLKPVSPALAGRFSTTAPPGKPLLSFLFSNSHILPPKNFFFPVFILKWTRSKSMIKFTQKLFCLWCISVGTLIKNWENRNIMYLCSWAIIVGNICGFYTVILSLCMYLCFFFPLPLILLSFNHFLKILFVVVKALLWFWVKKKCKLLCCLKGN